MSTILDRIIRHNGIQKAFDILVNMSGSDFQSLHIEIYKKRASKFKPQKIMKQSLVSDLVTVAKIDQRDMLFFDTLAYSLLSKDFKGMALSPVAPLGINSVLSEVDQKNILSTSRNTEVVADPTTVLALNCAEERKKLLAKDKNNADLVKLATSHRSIRGQSFKKIPGFIPHFRTFTLATAGKDTGHEDFQKFAFWEHISFYLDLLLKLKKEKKCCAEEVVVSFSDIRTTEAILKSYQVDRKDIRKNTQNTEYSLFKKYSVPLPTHLDTLEDLEKDIFSESLKTQNLNFLDSFQRLERAIVRELRYIYPNVTFNFDLERIAGIGYYDNFCFKIKAKNQKGEIYPLVDGGLVNWTQKLISSKKERCCISGIGSELLCNNF